MPAVLDPGSMLSLLKAAAEPTRLRILMLLAGGELNVKDLTRILGQSQPRISRHLKLLAEAGLIRRLRDGSWVYFQNVDEGVHGALLHRLLGATDADDSQLVRDRQRWDAVKREREAAAQAFFQSHAADWDRIRAMHVDEGDVEAAMGAALGGGPFGLFVDLGTGTGRSLELFADTYQRGIGLDINHTMLAYARGKLDAADLSRAQVRHGDLYHLGLADGAADAVVMHQVLHFLSDPALAIREAARVLAPGGRLLIVDFAPHDLEFLREEHAHDRLGFTGAQVEHWMQDAGLEPRLQRDLAPAAAAGPQALTVSLWLGERPQAAATLDKPARTRALQEAP